MEGFAEITALAALAVVVFQQILKLNVVPVYFANKYPVETNVILSIIAAVIVQWQTVINLTSATEWIAYVVTVSVVAAITYNMTLSKSQTVQAASNKVGK